MAVTVGFEPTVAINHTSFREMHLRPLGHVTNLSSLCDVATYEALADHQNTAIPSNRREKMWGNP